MHPRSFLSDSLLCFQIQSLSLLKCHATAKMKKIICSAQKGNRLYKKAAFVESVIFVFIQRTAPLLMKVWPVIAQWSFHRDSMLFVVTMGLQFTHETIRPDKSFIDANASQYAVICICFPPLVMDSQRVVFFGAEPAPSLLSTREAAGQAVRESGH